MGKGGGGTQTTTNTVPEWLKEYYTDELQAEQGVRNAALDTVFDPKTGRMRPYQPYKGQRLQGFTKDQKGAFNAIRKDKSGEKMVDQAQKFFKNGAQNYGKTHQATNVNVADIGPGNQIKVSGIRSLDQVDPRMWDGAAADNYMNPYRDKVIDSTVRRMGEENDRSRLANQARAAKSGAFGGGRHGVVDAIQEDQFQRSVGDTVGQLEDQAYSNAQQMFSQDMGRADQADMYNIGKDMERQQFNKGMSYQTQNQNWQNRNNVDQFNAGMNLQEQNLNNTFGLQAFNANRDQFNQDRLRDISSAGGLSTLAGVDRYLANDHANSLLNIGQMQQDFGQKNMDVAYQDWSNQKQWPYQNLNWLSALATGQPINPMSFSTQTTTSSGGGGGAANTAIGGVAALGGLASGIGAIMA
jgi:hypothetical protein